MADLTTPNTRRSATPVPTRGALAGTDSNMSDTADSSVSADISLLSLAPKNPLPYRQQLSCFRAFHTGMETLRDAGGSVTRPELAPKWLMPPIIIATSPQGGHDILGRSDAFFEKTIVHHELRHLLGANLFDLTHQPWLPRRRSRPGSTPTRNQSVGPDPWCRPLTSG